MSALTTRQDARERLRKMFEGALDQLIPPDESVPLKGSRFRDFEDQVEALGRQVLPVTLEERAALEATPRYRIRAVVRFADRRESI